MWDVAEWQFSISLQCQHRAVGLSSAPPPACTALLPLWPHIPAAQSRPHQHRWYRCVPTPGPTAPQCWQ